MTEFFSATHATLFPLKPPPQPDLHRSHRRQRATPGVRGGFLLWFWRCFGGVLFCFAFDRCTFLTTPTTLPPPLFAAGTFNQPSSMWLPLAVRCSRKVSVFWGGQKSGKRARSKPDFFFPTTCPPPPYPRPRHRSGPQIDRSDAYFVLSPQGGLQPCARGPGQRARRGRRRGARRRDRRGALRKTGVGWCPVFLARPHLVVDAVQSTTGWEPFLVPPAASGAQHPFFFLPPLFARRGARRPAAAGIPLRGRCFAHARRNINYLLTTTTRGKRWARAGGGGASFFVVGGSFDIPSIVVVSPPTVPTHASRVIYCMQRKMIFTYSINTAG